MRLITDKIMKNKHDIYRFIPKKGKVADNFDAYLRRKVIDRVEIRYDEKGAIERVDILCQT